MFMVALSFVKIKKQNAVFCFISSILISASILFTYNEIDNLTYTLLVHAKLLILRFLVIFQTLFWSFRL